METKHFLLLKCKLTPFYQTTCSILKEGMLRVLRNCLDIYTTKGQFPLFFTNWHGRFSLFNKIGRKYQGNIFWIELVSTEFILDSGSCKNCAPFLLFFNLVTDCEMFQLRRFKSKRYFKTKHANNCFCTNQILQENISLN